MSDTEIRTLHCPIEPDLEKRIKVLEKRIKNYFNEYLGIFMRRATPEPWFPNLCIPITGK